MREFDNTLSIEFFIESLINTEEWENLRDKTQVFNERVNKTVKSRGTHCDDVGDIAYKLSTLLGGDDVTCEKAKLIGLIHDLGHIPYGHAGESVADSIISDYEFSDIELSQIEQVRKLMFGDDYALKNNKPCFEHNENSVLQYITMCNRFGFEIDQEIIIGILSHSTSRYKELPQSLSQQAVRLADKLAYINFDVDDLFASFAEKEEERKALEDLYRKPLLDPNGKEIKITLSNGKSYTIYEFLTQLSSEDRIEAFINASVQDAKERAKNKPEKYDEYETVLTGCNDVIVEISNLRKAAKKAKTDEEKQQYYDKIEVLRGELYKRSPILYAAYEIKDRSDDFIRSGVGLSKDSQVDRTKNSLSAVGNKDLMNEYIYKSLVMYLQREIKTNESLSREQILERYHAMNMPKEFVDLYFGYMDFRKEQNDIILSLPGNNGTLYPEIYTIINFIGVHSNTQLTNLAKIGGLVNRFEREVSPQIQTLLNNPEFYDSEKGVFTKLGMKEREKLVSRYGSQIKLEFGLEEESISPLSSDETIKRVMETGYDVPDYEPSRNLEAKDKGMSDSSEFDAENAKANEALNNAGQRLGNVVIGMSNPENIEELTSVSKK